MPKLENQGHEAFAQLRVQGATTCDAFIAAGFKGRKNASRLYRIKAVNDRIQELKDDAMWGGTSDLTPVITLLAKAAEKAVNLNSAAALAAARGLLAEVARLKALRAETLERTAPPLRLETRLSDEAWLAKHAPRE
jgi:hypothetical protein